MYPQFISLQYIFYILQILSMPPSYLPHLQFPPGIKLWPASGYATLIRKQNITARCNNPVSKTAGGLACFLIRSQSVNVIYTVCSHEKVSVYELRTAGSSLLTVWQHVFEPTDLQHISNFLSQCGQNLDNNKRYASRIKHLEWMQFKWSLFENLSSYISHYLYQVKTGLLLLSHTHSMPPFSLC